MPSLRLSEVMVYTSWCWPGSRRNARREDRSSLGKNSPGTHVSYTYACPSTVKHIMIDCVEFAYIRSRFFDVRNMKHLFDSVTPSTFFKM